MGIAASNIQKKSFWKLNLDSPLNYNLRENARW